MKFQSCATASAILPILTKANCLTILQQASRIGFYQLPMAAAIGTDQTILTKAVYDAAIADATVAGLRLPQSKLFAPELGGTEPTFYGGNSNETPDGVSIPVGQSAPVFTAKYAGLSPDQYGELETVFAKGNASADFATLGVQFFLGDFQTIVGKDNKPIPIKATFIGDPTGMQLNDYTLFMFRFELPKGWYRDVKVVDLAFNHKFL